MARNIRRRRPGALVALGIACLAAGAGWYSMPAGLLVLGLCLVTCGLFLDDGTTL